MVKKQLITLIQEGKIDKLVNILRQGYETGSINTESDLFIQLSAQWSQFKRQEIENTLTPEEAKISRNTLSRSFLMFVNKLPDDLDIITDEQEVNNKGEIEPEKDTFSKEQIWKFILGVGVIVGIISGTFAILGINVKDMFTGGKVDVFSVSVIVHGKNGKDQPILRNQGEVLLDIGGKREVAPIDGNGQATFLQLAGGFKGDSALISIIHPQPYFPVNRDRKYILLPNKVIYLNTELVGMEKIKGRIIDAVTETFLDSVRVSVENYASYTDTYGWFQLDLPPEIQKKFIQVILSKPGYETVLLDSIAPHTNQEIQLSLNPIER
ncbi:MAG: hypothetical protein AAF824_23485 [Bacteroidota bacterium]